ncbi:hypothetical protein CRM22_001568 [Opisthorchis felineus]|uniref:Sphingomyelin phosphodiesterase 4 n=1 Tax=Opisthorchis felineus TaxID=147828 RepID=A0A4S2MGJ0_OPIFE|nr:hypothetical protein CRM22_001568 [Opisthorchis felineus]
MVCFTQDDYTLGETVCRHVNLDVFSFRLFHTFCSSFRMGSSEHALSARINELSSFLAQSSLQELQGAFTSIVDSIFGFSDAHCGWDLHELNESNNARLFNEVRKFLSPSGRLLSCIVNRITLEGVACKYDFPVSLLSTNSQNMIQCHGFTSTSCTVPLNAFEYYMFHFHAYPVHPKRRKNLKLNVIEHSLYAAVFTDYLAFYFYVEPTALASLSNHLQLAKFAPQITMYQRSYFTDHNPQYPVDTMEFQAHVSDKNFLWQTEVFLQAIFEFLLSWRSSTGLLGITEFPAARILPVIPQSHAELSFKPTSAHLFLVRCFIKYLYYTAFHHTPPESFQSPFQQLIYARIACYHRFLCNMLCLPPTDLSATTTHHNLMVQLKHLIIYCFQHWPMDLSFEIVIETWLTSIQPWRYADTPQPRGSAPSPLAQQSPPLCSPKKEPTDTAHSWVSFATQQYSLYVIPLLLFLQRSLRMDLRVPQNAHMVYRVAKILSQPGLKSMLCNAEEALLSQVADKTRIPLSEGTDVLSTVEQTGLWGEIFRGVVADLVQAISTAVNEIHSQTVKRSSLQQDASLWTRFTNFIADLILDNGDKDLRNAQKCEQHLKDAASMLQVFFSVTQACPGGPHSSASTPSPTHVPGRLLWDDISESPLLPARPTVDKQTPHRRVQFVVDTPSLHGDTPTFTISTGAIPRDRVASCRISDDRPDAVVTPFGWQQLTPLGRFQILMGQRRPELRCTGDREYLPACTYEVPVLVELFRFLSALINMKMRSRFITWCSTPGLLGWAARRLLVSTPSSAEETGSDGCHQSAPIPSSSSITQEEPKISLRWLASYTVLCRIGVMYALFFAFCGIRSPVAFFFCSILMYIAYQISRLIFLLGKDFYEGRKIF